MRSHRYVAHVFVARSAAAPENIIAVDDIALVLVETKWDSDRLIVKDLAGQTVCLPAECVPDPLAGWAAALFREFSKVQFETD